MICTSLAEFLAPTSIFTSWLMVVGQIFAVMHKQGCRVQPVSPRGKGRKAGLVSSFVVKSLGPEAELAFGCAA